jgi:hypothetical protein
MVAHNPVLRGGFSLKKFNATVINGKYEKFHSFILRLKALQISGRKSPFSPLWLPVRFPIVRYFPARHNDLVVSLVSEMTSHKLRISPALLTVLGTVLGLVISFRTSSAYER